MPSMAREILIGGSGKQGGAIHLPVLLDASRGDSRLAAIADPVDPLKSPFTSKHAEALRAADTRWVPLTGDIGQDLGRLTKFAKETPSDTLVISCPPLLHADYIALGLNVGMDVIIDKPFLSLPNQFGNPEAPEKLQEEYERLKELRRSSKHRKYDRECKVSVPLMRRAVTPYTDILKDLSEVYEVTGQHLTNMQTTRSDGCFRFPDEFDRPGAHGYRDGLGALTQSGYHYLDYMAACVSSAPPEGTQLNSRMTSQTTVFDGRHASQGTPFSRFLGRTNTPPEQGGFQGDNAELDFSVNLSLGRPSAPKPDCDLQFTFIQNGATRRVSPSYPPDATHDEGLTNDCSTVIHQGQLQSFHLLVAMDGVNGGRATLARRLNPKLAAMLGQKALTITDYDLKASENVERNRAMVSGLLDNFSGGDNHEYDLLDANYQDLTMQLYGAALGASVAPYTTSVSNLWVPGR